MKQSIIHKMRRYLTNCCSKQRDRIQTVESFPDYLISQNICSKKTQEFINDLKVRNLIHYSLPSIDANELIIDSLSYFRNPFKVSVLVMENFKVVGTLNLLDVITNLNASKDLNSGFCTISPVRCLMNRVFVPLEFQSYLSEVIIDLLNSESSIHPVYDRGRLKGVLYKDTILDIIKLQMLEEAVLI